VFSLLDEDNDEVDEERLETNSLFSIEKYSELGMYFKLSDVA
jgi:hypothetical protein